MEVFRLNREKYADGLSGAGAALRGARWNSRGREVIYTSSSRALAMAEVLVHVSMDTMPNDYLMLSISLPDSISMDTVSIDDLPANWPSFSGIRHTQQVGDLFLQKGASCVLKVPSVVVPGDFNFLINPYHEEFPLVSIVQRVYFPFDSRFFSS